MDISHEVPAGLHVSGLHKRYGDTVALAGCDLTVDQGQLVGFLGPNGAGKSTVMRAIVGLIPIDDGTVDWNGQAIDGDVRRRFGYMPQARGLYKRMRVHEQVAYFGRLGGLELCRDVVIIDDGDHRPRPRRRDPGPTPAS